MSNKAFKRIIFTIFSFFRDQYFININIVYIKYFFVFVVEVTFFYFFCRRNLCYFHSFFYSVKKRKIFFYNNLDVHALIVYFCFVLIDLINDYTKS